MLGEIAEQSIAKEAQVLISSENEKESGPEISAKEEPSTSEESSDSLLGKQAVVTGEQIKKNLVFFEQLKDKARVNPPVLRLSLERNSK